MDHFEILSRDKQSTCKVDVVTAEFIKVSRKPNQIFTFKDPERFLDALISHSNIVVHTGKPRFKDGEKVPEEEVWHSYFWEPRYEEQKSSYSAAKNILPCGSLAIFQADNQHELIWELERRQTDTRKFLDLWRQVERACRAIQNIDRNHEYADADRFRFMGLEELKIALAEVQEAHKKLAHRGTAEIAPQQEEDEY